MAKIKITGVQKCRLCSRKSLKEVVDFGMTSLPTWPRSKNGGTTAPLTFVVCTKCLLGQLKHSIDRESLFREYWYRTGMNDTMRSHMQSLAQDVSKEIDLGNNDLVMDIGANDGTLLSFYKRGRLIGFEPSGLCPKKNRKNTTWINEFFDPLLISKKDRGNAKAVTSIAMFYYLDDPIDFASKIESLLSPTGIWVCEMNYALDMMERNSFDHISHEHVTCWSAGQFKKVVDKIGLEIFRVGRNDLNGGSIRFWVGRKNKRKVESSVKKILALEDRHFTLEAWAKFSKKVRHSSTKLREMVFDMNKNNKVVMAYGSSTRGLTILAASGLDSSTISAAVEKNPEKVGRYYANTGIPVISEEEMRKIGPDALLILPYSFVEEFTQRESEFLENGGIFLVPLPEPKKIAKRKGH